MPTHNLQPLIERIDALLPQTQCRRCGYAGCQPYAEAIALRCESVNLCPPGGESTRLALSAITGQALNPTTPIHPEPAARVAYVIEAECIGCTKCIQACPVDAIVGAAARMHSVVQQWCTGCDLCAPVCPTDCIDMVVRTDAAGPSSADSRARYATRTARQHSLPEMNEAGGYVDLRDALAVDIKNTIAAAVERRRVERASLSATDEAS